MNFSVSDRGKRDHGHVKRVGEAPSLEDHVPKNAYSGNHYERQNGALHPPQREPWFVGPPVIATGSPAFVLRHRRNYSRAACLPWPDTVGLTTPAPPHAPRCPPPGVARTYARA